MVKLSKAKLEYGRLLLKFMEAKTFNNFTLEIKEKSLDERFKSSLEIYLTSN